MKHYFKKEILSNGLRDSNGNLIHFEACAENCGVIALDDENPATKPLLDDLNKIAGSRGVGRIDEKKYEELKKKVSLKKPLDPSKEPRIFDPNAELLYNKLGHPKDSNAPAAPAPASVVPAVEKSPAAPVEAPAPFKPRRGQPRKK